MEEKSGQIRKNISEEISKGNFSQAVSLLIAFSRAGHGANPKRRFVLS